MPSINCTVKDCWKSPESKHRFPNPDKYKPVFDKWVNLCGNKRLVSELTPAKIYTNCRVCSLHFRPEDFGFNHKLKTGVIPSLNLPDPLYPVQEDPEPSAIRNDQCQQVDKFSADNSRICQSYSESENTENGLQKRLSGVSCKSILKETPTYAVDIVSEEDFSEPIYTTVTTLLSDNLGLKRKISIIKPSITDMGKSYKVLYKDLLERYTCLQEEHDKLKETHLETVRDLNDQIKYYKRACILQENWEKPSDNHESFDGSKVGLKYGLKFT